MSEDLNLQKQLNRLRAAIGLIPIIESGLNRSTISPEKAALMSEFCAWALEHSIVDNHDVARMTSELKEGLVRVGQLLDCRYSEQTVSLES
jgi:hypothetical protein